MFTIRIHSFAGYSLFSRSLLQKRPNILRSVLIAATPQHKWVSFIHNTDSYKSRLVWIDKDLSFHFLVFFFSFASFFPFHLLFFNHVHDTHSYKSTCMNQSHEISIHVLFFFFSFASFFSFHLLVFNRVHDTHSYKSTCMHQSHEISFYLLVFFLFICFFFPLFIC